MDNRSANTATTHSRTPSRSISAAFTSATSSSAAVEGRASHLDLSALSPAEYAVYPQWLNSIKPSRSGEPEHIDEQDALRFLREECGIEVRDEIRILSLFERFPLGLLPGHFFALLRLAAWVQRGQTPTKQLLFTQTSPPDILSAAGVSQPLQGRVAPSSPRTQILYASPKTPETSPRARAGSGELTTAKTTSVPGLSNSVIQASGSTPPLVSSATPKIGTHQRQGSLADAAPPVPDDSHKPHNPFRHAAPPIPASSSHAQQQGIVGHDPAPNPFKQSKPKIVRPTPIVANASTPVLRRQSPVAIDPFRSGASVSSHGGSPVSGRSYAEGGAGGHGELKPPPLPPRHISPLIQASLHARSEVRKKQEALPPKTFTVLQSTSARHAGNDAPRLLSGKAAPSLAAPSRRRGDGGRTSSASAAGRAAADESIPQRRAGPLPLPIAPKPSYGAKGKTGIPAWLREQEELQRTMPLDHHNEPNMPPREGTSRSGAVGHARGKKRTTSEIERIQFLDNESDSGSEQETLSEQARSAASIDRNNPFFQHGRDQERSVDLRESLSKLAVENAVTKAERDSKLSARATSETSTTRGDGDSRKPMGRSKTLRDSSSRGGMMPPMIPPRKRNDVGPVPLNSGTYPGFGKSVRTEGPTVGGLRQMPTSRKAEVGLPSHVIAERERMERERQQHSDLPLDASRPGPPPPPPPRRRSSNSQMSGSEVTTTGPRSPSDDAGVDERQKSMADTLKEDFAALMERQQWAVHGKRPFDEARVGLMTQLNGPGTTDNDEPEVDEHYLAEKRKEEEQQHRQHSAWLWQQRDKAIGMIREEDASPRPRTASTPTNTHPLPRRVTPEGLRRSVSGAANGGGGGGHARRGSLLSRGSVSAEDVVDDDDVPEMSDSERTPRERTTEGEEQDDFFVDAVGDGAPEDVKKGTAPDIDTSSGPHSNARPPSSGSGSSASGRSGALLTDAAAASSHAQHRADGWQQLS